MVIPYEPLASKEGRSHKEKNLAKYLGLEYVGQG